MSNSNFRAANKLKREGKLEEAIVLYRLAIRRNCHFSWLHYKLGEILEQTSCLNEAVATYLKCIELNPNSAWFHYKLGLALSQLGKQTDAVSYLQKAASLSDKNFYKKTLDKLLVESNARKKSLLLIGFPRGFTSDSYEIIRKATGLKSSKVSAGEVLNYQRLQMAGFVDESLKLKFNFYTKNLEAYPTVEEQLNAYTKGFIIKDVVQPWLILEYLERNPNSYNVLFISRNLEEVLFHLKKKNWGYTGLEELQKKFSVFPTLNVELALHNTDYLFDTVEKLGYATNRFNYIDEAFIEKREISKKIFSLYGKSLEKLHFIYNYDLIMDTPVKLFLHENPVHPYLQRQGWSNPEKTGTWTQEKVAQVIFSVDTFYESDLCMIVEIDHVFVHQNHPKQIIDIFANGILIDRWEFNYDQKNDKSKECIISHHTINSNPRLFISFQISHPESPSKIGISQDTRTLGIKIKQIKFKTATVK